MPSSKPHPLQKAARRLIRNLLSSTPASKPKTQGKLPKTKPSGQSSTAPRSRYIPTRTRYLVLKRDGNRCQHCGTTCQEAQLQIDHIIPFSLGGSNTMDNLQTLCRDCNLGKSNRP